MATLWPYTPLPNFRETLETTTGLMQTRSVDWRWSKHEPRHTFSMVFPMAHDKFREAEALLRSNINGEWIVPMWQDATPISEAIGATVISCDVDASFFVGGYAVAGAGTNDISTYTISAIGVSDVTLSSGLSDNVDGILAPARVCYADGISTRRGLNGAKEIAVNFVANELPSFSGISAYPSHDGYPVLMCGDVRSVSDSGRIYREAKFHDSMYGALDFNNTREVVEELRAMTLRYGSRSKRWGLVRLLHFLRGRDGELYTPKIEGRIGVLSNTSTSATFEVGTFSASDVGTVVALSESTIREILTVSGGGETITFTDIGVETLSHVRRLVLSYLDSDSIAIDHIRGLSATSILPFRSIQ